MIRKHFFWALLTWMLCLSATAQQLGTWHMYLSYYIATKSEASSNVIYSLMNGNLLSYDIEDGEVRTYDNLNGLNDVNIAFIAYSKEAEKLLIVYSNSNIDLLDKEGIVHNLSALKDKRILGKEVVDVSIQGHTAYIATNFGFLEVDMKEGVFRNTYKLDFAISCIAASDKYVFLGTNEGLMRGLKSSNLQVRENWVMRATPNNFKKMYISGDLLIGMRTNNIVRLQLEGTGYPQYCEGKFNFLKETGGMFIWGNDTQIGYTTDLKAEPTIISVENKWSDISYVGGTYWMSEQENGLRGYKLNGTEMVPTGEVIQPSSPIRDIGYNLSWAGNRLLVAGGINTVGSFYNPATSMYYEDGKWTNFTEMEVPPEFPSLRIRNTTNLVQDPLDDTHHFASLCRIGLCEYKNAKCVKHYTQGNSPLKSIIPSLSSFYNYVLCSALTYDADGNLWMAQAMRDSALHVLKPDGKWYNPYYEELDNVSQIDQILHHSSGLKFIVSRSAEKRGIVCIDTKGTERTTDDKVILHQNIINQDGTPYLPNEFYGLCEDLDGCVWVCTSVGLFAIDDVTKVFSSDFQFTQTKINRNDGSGLADYLLNEVSVMCITVDAANRKWIGTEANGAYLISADGQEMIHHFMVEDSPILSNNVQSIAVHPETGEVVFGTDKGICSYMSDATMPEEELKKSNITVFPNPVTPDYNGPIAIRGLVSDTEVKIISTGGQLVWNGVSAGGTCLWNGLANNGRRVASGIYHVVANTPEGNKAIVTRIVVVR